MSGELYFTNERLTRQLAGALDVHNLKEWSTGHMMLPLDEVGIRSLPPAIGAYTLPPMGRFSTPVNVTDQPMTEAEAAQPRVLVLGAVVAAMLAFLPML